MSDVTAARLAEVLPGRAVRYFPALDSTNTTALDWLTDHAPAGAVVVADSQSAGRGRLGRTWFAPEGSSLLFTYLFYAPAISAHRASMLGALAVTETLREYHLSEVGIKYPNDVQVGRRKLCGVLAEAHWSDPVAIALGIGLNVRVDFTGTPFAETAVSLEPALGKPVDRAVLLADLVRRLDFWRARLGTNALFAAWRSSLNMLGDWVDVNTGTGTATGLAEDVTADGALLLRDPNGVRREVWAGDFLVKRG